MDLLRGEARLAQVEKGEASHSHTAGSGIEAVSVSAPAVTDRDAFIREYAEAAKEDASLRLEGPRPGPGPGPGKKRGDGEEEKMREEGRERWDDFLRRRFVLGRDDDFDYRPVDENDDYDAIERREQEDGWFNDEDPAWAGEEASVGEAQGRNLEGETGIQDF